MGVIILGNGVERSRGWTCIFVHRLSRCLNMVMRPNFVLFLSFFFFLYCVEGLGRNLTPGAITFAYSNPEHQGQITFFQAQ